MRKMNNSKHRKGSQRALQSNNWLFTPNQAGNTALKIHSVEPTAAEPDANAGISPVSFTYAEEGEIHVQLDFEGPQDMSDEPVLASAYDIDSLDEEDSVRSEDKGTTVGKGSAPRDPLRSYFEDIGRIPLLSTEETSELFKQLTKARKKGESIRESELKDKAVTANLRLVVSISKRFSNCGIPLLDLIQAGNLGLMRAVDGFDYKLGFKFSTYASRWILAAILRTLSNQSRIVRIPVNVIPSLRKLALKDSHAKETGSGKSPAPDGANIIRMDDEQIRKMTDLLQHPISLDQVLDEETGFTVLDTFSNDMDGGSSVTKNLDLSLLREQVEEMLETLDPREQEVLKLRYGLEDGVEYTQSEIAEKMNISRQRISQIEKRALLRMRACSGTRCLRSYLN